MRDTQTWLINLHDFCDHRLEDGGVARIIHAILEWKIDRIVLAESRTDVLDVASPGKILAKLVEGYRQHAVGRVKRLRSPAAA